MQSDAYLELVSRLPRPTPEQTGRFVEFVAGAHSWYKHLPPLPPGAPFAFFLNPDAGRSRVRTPSGEVAFVDRVDGDATRFHYSWMPTADYRARFGHWDYHSEAAPGFLLLGPGRETYDHSTQVTVLGAEGDWLLPPAALLRAGSCRLTAHVHLLLNPGTWRRHTGALRAFAELERRAPQDPEVLRYRGLASALSAGWSQGRSLLAQPSPSLRAFHAQERERLRACMRTAMERALEWLAPAWSVGP